MAPVQKGGPPLVSEGVLAPFLRDEETPQGVKFFQNGDRQDASAPPVVSVAGQDMRKQGPLGLKSLSREAFANALQAAQMLNQKSAGDTVVHPDAPAPEASVKQPDQPAAREAPQAGEAAPQAEEAPEKVQPAGGPGEEEKPDIASLSLMGVARSGLENRVNPMVMRDPTYMQTIMWKSSPARREWIEKHCGPIDKDALFTGGEIRQDVLLWTNPRISVCFRTLTGDDEYWLRRILRERYGESDSELELGFVVAVVAGGVVEYGPVGQRARWPDIPSPYSAESRKRKREVLDDRINRALGMPYTLLTDLAVNYAWFIERVQREQKEMDLGNG